MKLVTDMFKKFIVEMEWMDVSDERLADVYRMRGKVFSEESALRSWNDVVVRARHLILKTRPSTTPRAIVTTSDFSEEAYVLGIAGEENPHLIYFPAFSNGAGLPIARAVALRDLEGYKETDSRDAIYERLMGKSDCSA